MRFLNGVRHPTRKTVLSGVRVQGRRLRGLSVTITGAWRLSQPRQRDKVWERWCRRRGVGGGGCSSTDRVFRVSV